MGEVRISDPSRPHTIQSKCNTSCKDLQELHEILGVIIHPQNTCFYFGTDFDYMGPESGLYFLSHIHYQFLSLPRTPWFFPVCRLAGLLGGWKIDKGAH